ncbi:MAG: outer membrane beta-barrel protein [Bacteroidetes bacterium]|nr:outer membrane beta-barrel protein [Bacteroidota bacterium]
MQNIGNDDMDNLFKKAADHCDLNEQLAADWDNVHAAIQKAYLAEDFPDKKKKRRRFLFLWWFIIPLTAFFIAYQWIVFKPQPDLQKQETHSLEENNKTNEALQNNPDSNIQSAQLPGEFLNQPQKLPAQGMQTGALQNQKDAYNSFSKGQSNVDFSKNGIQKNLNDPIALSPIQNGNKQNIDKIIQYDTTTAGLNKLNENKNLSVTNTSKGNFIPNEKENESSPPSMMKDENKMDQKTKKTKNKKTAQSFWSIGLTANADLSFIKNQQVSRLGLGGGLLAGYHFSNGLGIQTGILFDKKNYYTSGQFFDTKKIELFQSEGTTLNFANGYCKMWEIPINISYDIQTGKKTSLLITAGVSSYIMQNEFYNLNYNLNRYDYDSAYNFPHSSKDFFAAVNLGAGVNFQANKNTAIQLQPYFKVPIKGIGIGNLSIKSAGLNITLMKQFH